MTDKQQLLYRRAIHIERAREACLQALYFLGFGWKTNDDAVNRAVESYTRFSAFQVNQLLSATKSDSLGAAGDSIHDAWVDITETPEGWHYPNTPEKAATLRDKLRKFLDVSRGQGREGTLFRYQTPYFFLSAHRRLAALLTAGVIAFLCFRMEILSGLLAQAGWTLAPMLLMLAAPAFAVRRWPASDGVIRRIRLGMPPFHWTARTVEPRKSVERWPYMTDREQRKDEPKTRHILEEIYRARVMRTLVVLACWAAVAVLIWLIFPSAARTTFLVLALLGSAILAADWLDQVEFTSHLPIRFGAIVLAVIVAAAVWRFERAGALGVIALLAGCSFYLYRNRCWPGAKYLSLASVLAFFVAASGAGTHERESWSAPDSAWSRIPAENWPLGGAAGPPVVVVAASGGGSRAAVYAGRTLERLHDLEGVGENLQLISSVSGGSLANAAYVVRRLQGQPLEGLSTALAGDFIFPTLKGALVPFNSRGAAIEAEWETGPVGLEQLHLSDLASAWRGAGQSSGPPFPLPLFNSVTLSGHLVGISPLEAAAFVDVDRRRGVEAANLYDGYDYENQKPTWVYYRDLSYGLDQVLPTFDPRLSQAVRASANFPFGFPVVRVPSPSPMIYSPGDVRSSPVELTDGGALSNSGFLSLFQLLMNRAGTLRDRGVLVVVVEASKMPEYDTVGTSLNRLRGVIGDQNPIARNLHERMYDILEATYGDRIAIAQVDLPAEEDVNVMTTWALDPDTLAVLEQVFERRWSEERDGIAAKWNALASRQALAEMIDRRRPPLD